MRVAAAHREVRRIANRCRGRESGSRAGGRIRQRRVRNQGGDCARRGEDSKHPRPLPCHAPPQGRRHGARHRACGVKRATLARAGRLRARRVLADWTEKARHKATRRASGARCGPGASDGAAEGVPFVELQPEGVSMTLDGLLRTPVATAYGGSSLRSSGDTNGRWRFLRSVSRKRP